MENIHGSERGTGPAGESLDKGKHGQAPALKPVGVLAGFDDQSLADLAPYGRYDPISPEAVLMREGDLQSRFYIIVAGRLAVSARSLGKEVALSVAEPGECLGEVNLLEPGAASATIRALESSTVWSMDNVDLRRYLTEHAGGCGVLLIGITSCLSKRLRQTNEIIRQNHVAPVEALPRGESRAITAGNTTVPIGFFDRLKKSLGAETKVRISTEIKM